MKKYFALIIVIAVTALAGCGSITEWQYYGVDHYAHDVNYYGASGVMPDLESITNSVEIKYTFKHASDGAGGYSSAMALFVKYNTDTYAGGAALANEILSSQESSGVTFNYRNYQMNVAQGDKGDGKLMLVGFSSKNKICYIFIDDKAFENVEDSDAAKAEFTDFLTDAVYWNYQ